MKILHLCSEFPPARIFGLGRYVHDLAQAQVRAGHEVHVLTNSLSGRDQDVSQEGVGIHRIHFPSPPMPPDGATQVMQFNISLFERLVELAPLLDRPDVIVTHDWLTAIAGDSARRRLGGRLIVTMHDTVIGKTFGKMTNEDKYIAQVERWACRTADGVVAVSAHVKKELTSVYEVPEPRIHVVPCGVSPVWFQTVRDEDLPDLRSALAEGRERIVLYVGRLDPEKGVEILLRAFRNVLQEFPSLRLVIAGKGKEQPALDALARELGIEQQSRFLGYVTGPALEALYKISDLLVCPSLYEPFGIVPLEGMVTTLPVIATDVGGMAEIVEDGVSGLKVPPGNVPALAWAIKRILANPELAQALAREGEVRARTVYSWDRVAEGVAQVYGGKQALIPAVASRRLKLTAGIRVKNGERFAEECLRDLCEYVDEIVILDDGSTDRTIEICRSFSKVTQIVRWEKSFFHEGIDRNVVLALVKNTNPDWILLPDIDEVFEDRFKTEIRRMMETPDVGLYAFLFRHFWRSRTHYRVDGKWGRETREFPIPRLVRNHPGLFYPVDKALGTAQIRGIAGRGVVSDIRVKHYGHLYSDISKAKVSLYSSLDPSSDYSYMIDETGLELEEWREFPTIVGANP